MILPLFFIPFILIPGLGVATAAVALAFWPKIRSWSEEALFPWLERHLPTVTSTVRNAFAAIDNVVTAVRRTIKQAWHALREHLLHQVMIFERRSSSQWVRRITSWMVKVLSNGQRVPVQVVTETVFATDELPSEVRAQWLRNGLDRYKIEASDIRDKELAEIS